MRKQLLASLVFLFVGMLVTGSVIFFSRVLSPSDTTIALRRSPEDGDRIVVTFRNATTEALARSRVQIEPPLNGEFVWFPDERELHFVAADGFVPEKNYRVIVSPPSRLSAAIGAGTQTFAFTETQGSPGARSFDLAPPAQGKALDVNLSTMIITLLENGVPVKTLPVAGKGNPWATPTREGRFSVLSKEDRHWSTIYKLWMPYSMRFSGSYFLHGWPYWPDGRQLTSRYSGGCVRFTNDVARELSSWADVGTAVIVHSTPGRVPLLSLDAIHDGDLIQQAGTSDVYVVKIAGEKRFRRHVLTPDFAEWYPHLQPFWKNVKTAPAETVNAFRRSRWVWSETPSDSAGHRFIYEISENGTKHLMRCRIQPSSAVEGPEYCAASWDALGWDHDELFTVSPQELASYPEGDLISLPARWELVAGSGG